MRDFDPIRSDMFMPVEAIHYRVFDFVAAGAHSKMWLFGSESLGSVDIAV